MKYLLISDIHASDKAPSSCTDRYMADLLDLLRQTVALARERDVAAVAWAGDTFHSKAPARVSHRLVQQLSDVIRSYHCPCYLLAGNHDLRNDRADSIDETQPLGVLYRSGAQRLEGWADGLPLYGVPWLQEWSDEAVSAALAGYRERPGISLVVAHSPLYPPGKELQFEFYPAGAWAGAMGGQGYCFYGHVHEPHGTYRAGGVTFCNNGALSRGSLHEYNLTRGVGCTVWDDETGEFEFVPLDAPPSDQVFRLTEQARLTDMQGLVGDYMDSIKSARLDVLSAESVLAHVKSLGLGRAAEEAAEELLAEAAHRRR